MAKHNQDVFVVIDYGVTYDNLFLTAAELARLKVALRKRPKGASTTQIDYKPRPESARMTKTIVLDRILTITP